MRESSGGARQDQITAGNCSGTDECGGSGTDADWAREIGVR